MTVPALDAAVPDLRALYLAVAAAPTARSPVHGIRHWAEVAAAGLHLAHADPGADPGADPAVVLLFALLHDGARDDDGRDPGHGRRAAALLDRLHDDGLLALEPDRLAVLRAAVAGHVDGTTSTDPTVGVCWDADRLGLWRCGIRPDPALLSTAAARDPAAIEWARGLQHQALSWDELAASYRHADARRHRPPKDAGQNLTSPDSGEVSRHDRETARKAAKATGYSEDTLKKAGTRP